MNPFIYRIKTDNAGISGNDSFYIGTNHSEYTYDFTVDWGDGNVETFTNANISHSSRGCYHTYSTAGTYNISISGTFPHLYHYSTSFSRQNDVEKIIDVIQWGDIQWKSAHRMFGEDYYGSNITTFTATDTPDFSQVTDMSEMFGENTVFNADISNWDVSNVTNMYRVFNDCEVFNQPLDSWDVSNVTNMEGIFSNASVFNQPLNSWNVSNVTNMRQMFWSANQFNQPLNNWNVSNVINMEEMFKYCGDFNQPLNNWDVSNVTNMLGMFQEASTFSQDLSGWCVENIPSMDWSFDYLTDLTTEQLPVWGTCPGTIAGTELVSGQVILGLAEVINIITHQIEGAELISGATVLGFPDVEPTFSLNGDIITFSSPDLEQLELIKVYVLGGEPLTFSNLSLGTAEIFLTTKIDPEHIEVTPILDSKSITQNHFIDGDLLIARAATVGEPQTADIFYFQVVNLSSPIQTTVNLKSELQENL